MLRSSILQSSCKSCSLLSRSSIPSIRSKPAATIATVPRFVRFQTHDTHAISNPTLANIEKRWEQMPPQEQADLWMALRDRMKINWHEMTLQEKKAAYWIAFGPHGPRAQDPPGEGMKVFGYTVLGISVAIVIMWGLRSMAGPPPSTMTKEWQEKTNEYLKSQNIEPITGISSEGYIGKGQIQSPPKRT